MKPVNSPERGIQIKIGIIVLVIVLYFSGVLIYSLNLKRSIDEQKSEIEASYTILAHTNNLIFSVQEAQNTINAYLANPQRIRQQQYDSVSLEIKREISVIRSISKRESQNQLLQNIDSLLNEKNAIARKLIRQFRARNPLEEVDRKIESSYADIVKDTVPSATQKDTTIVVKGRKDLWGRVKELFKPSPEADTTINITSTAQDTLFKSRMDTLMYGNLRSITQEASETYSLKMQGIERQVRDLVLAEQAISIQLSQLLTRFYNQTMQTAGEKLTKSEELTRKIFLFAVAVGALSLLLIAAIVFLIADDLKKAQQTRQELAKEKQLTENLMESRHKLLLSVSHDIKTPLSSILGYLEMWGQQKTPPLPKQQLLSAQSSGKYMLNMLSNLLEFSRLEQNSAKLHKSRFNLIELVDEIIGMFRPLVQENSVTISFENQTPAPFYVETDHTMLKQILANVVSNAVKYTRKGSIRILLQHAENVIFTISDTGTGIDKENIPSVFLPFSRTGDTLKTEGSGLGLYVTKKLVDTLQGSILLTSEKDAGTSVKITLPLQRVQPHEKLPAKHAPHAAYRSVLLVEDNVPLGNMVREILVQKGYSVALCTAIEEIKTHLNRISAFDIVFTDMEMGHVSGKDVLHAVRRRGSQIPVWLMTAHDDYTNDIAVAQGFSGLMPKPIQMNVLAEILSSGESETPPPQSLNARFPALTALLGDDEEALREILEKFVETTRSDTQTLVRHIQENNFAEAQHLCHKMHPFLAQLNAQHLCPVLRKMDTLRGQNESAYPQWKEELRDTIEKLRDFVDAIDGREDS